MTAVLEAALGLAGQSSPARDHFRDHLRDATDECMIWPHATDRNGYGTLKVGERLFRVHVLSCIEHHGPRPPGMDAAHGPCHDRRCWNGRHLSWKSRSENNLDARRDDTHRLGEANPMAKLTTAQVTEMRDEYARGGVTQRLLAERYGIHPGTVHKIVRGKRWSA